MILPPGMVARAAEKTPRQTPALVSPATASQGFPMTKKTKPTPKKKSAPKKAPRKDASQVALSIVERVTGGKLKSNR